MVPKLFIQSRVTSLSIYPKLRSVYDKQPVLVSVKICEKKSMKQSQADGTSTSLKKNALLTILFFICHPIGVWRIWRSNNHVLLKIIYSLLGIPLFVVSYSFLAILVLAAVLPPLDLTVGDRKDRTIV